MNPSVSILIPAYNAEAYIGAAIGSALAQTWPEKEIVVVDDGSADGTVEVVKRFTGLGVRLLEKENGGAAAARNFAYRHCRGDYIQWLDADDLLSPEKVSKQMEALLESGSDGVLASCPWGRFIHRPRHARFVPTSLWCDLSPADWMVRKMGENSHMQTATWLTSRKLCEAAGSWNEDLLSDDDGEYFSRVILASEKIRFVRESRVYYRVMPSNRLSHIGFSDRKKDAMVQSMKLHIRNLLAVENSERTQAACLRYIHTWLIYFYPEREDLVEELRAIAAGLGGELTPPKLRWKYAWLAPVLGWENAKGLQTILPEWKARLQAAGDWWLWKLESFSALRRDAAELVSS
jgi:glycosyltransferase involved in cell wall biosynthesis